ncbi:MAG: hypothetical protein JW881_01475 [Spirochaetales bacterium]|nr:hypothetical protein [Spirochaetales bacterium]
MKIEGLMQLPQLYNQSVPQEHEYPVIDEKMIKSILYLGLKGDIQIEPEENHSVDTFA